MKACQYPPYQSFITGLLLALVMCFACTPNSESKPMPRVLIFFKTAGFHHKSIADGTAAIQKLAKENRFSVDTTRDASLFTQENLKQYKLVIFLSTTGNVLNDDQQKAFEYYITNGGGYLGIHAAADTEYEWPWYNELVGAYFVNHPKVQQATIKVVDKKNPATRHLPDTWTRTDEWYNYKNIMPGLTVLCKLDESTYEGGQNGADHPIVWCHLMDKGRAFYTGLGHTPESWSEPMFLQHVLGGIKWVMGEK